MKQILLLTILILISLSLHSQNDTVSVVRSDPQKTFLRETNPSPINIYPVPVRQNSFTIRTEKEMTLVKVTNMIGQDIFRAQYKNPVPITKVMLNKPTRGMYLVTISFIDGTRVVKKIMIENPE
jgi:Secretion system C-terminal sorting domain